MEPQKKLLMIVNPRAGRSKPRGPLYDAAAALCDAGYLLRIRRTTAAGDAARIAAQEGGDYDTVVAVGGDGTLNEVISGIQTLKTPRRWVICLRGAPMILPPAWRSPQIPFRRRRPSSVISAVNLTSAASVSVFSYM